MSSPILWLTRAHSNGDYHSQDQNSYSGDVNFLHKTRRLLLFSGFFLRISLKEWYWRKKKTWQWHQEIHSFPKIVQLDNSNIAQMDWKMTKTIGNTICQKLRVRKLCVRIIELFFIWVSRIIQDCFGVPFCFFLRFWQFGWFYFEPNGSSSYFSLFWLTFGMTTSKLPTFTFTTWDDWDVLVILAGIPLEFTKIFVGSPIWSTNFSGAVMRTPRTCTSVSIVWFNTGCKRWTGSVFTNCWGA